MFNFLSFHMFLLHSILFKHAIHFLACITLYLISLSSVPLVSKITPKYLYSWQNSISLSLSNFKLSLKWMLKQKRAWGRPKKNWMEGLKKAMNERNLNEGQWEDRKQWSLGVGQHRKTFWTLYIHTLYKFVHFRKANLGKLLAVILCVLIWVQASLLHHYVRQFWVQIQNTAISRTWENSIICLSPPPVLFSCPALFCSHRFSVHPVIWWCLLWRQWDLFLLLVSTLCVVMHTEGSTVA